MRTEYRGLRTEGQGSRLFPQSSPLSPHPSALNPQSSAPSPQSSKGFTLLELIVVICIVVVLMGTFLNRVLYYQEQAERAAMVEVAGALQIALTLQHGRLLVHGKEADLAALATANPMTWLQKKPRNYSGEFYAPTSASIQPGNWVFDLKSRELIYVPERTEHFIPDKNGNKWIRYRVNLAYDPVRSDTGKAEKELVGTLFEPVETYRWFD